MMKILFNVFVISVLILGLISSPFSFAQTSEGSENIAIALEESISITSNDNEIEDTETEDTETEDTETNSDNSNLGQEVSNFVHEARKLFEQQKIETKEIIAQCREDVRNAEPSEQKSVREECKSNLEEIRESYKTLRETYRETFKEFRENMMVFIQESKGLPTDSTERDAAIANIKFLSDSSEKRELLRELQQKMNEQIREDNQKLREQEKREREIVREELKDEREALREALKDEREALRGAGIESSDDEFKDEQELEIEVEVEQGIAQITVESNGEEFEFQMDWIDEQSVVAEIASRTGLTASQIEEVIEFEIELEDESEEDDDDHEDDNEEDDDHEDDNEDDVDSKES